MTNENSSQKRVTCALCEDKIPKVLAEEFTVKKSTKYLCQDCVSMVAEKLGKVKETLTPVAKTSGGLILVSAQKTPSVAPPSKEKVEQMEAELEQLKTMFPKGCTVKIVGGVYGNPNQEGTVLGYKPAVEKGEWHLFVGVDLDGHLVLKYPKNIEKV